MSALVVHPPEARKRHAIAGMPCDLVDNLNTHEHGTRLQISRKPAILLIYDLYSKISTSCRSRALAISHDIEQTPRRIEIVICNRFTKAAMTLTAMQP